MATRPKRLLFSLGILASLLTPACTTYLLGPADRASLRDANALEAQVWRDEADDAGVSKALLRAEEKRDFCAVRDVLRRSFAQDDAGALPCGSGR